VAMTGTITSTPDTNIRLTVSRITRPTDELDGGPVSIGSPAQSTGSSAKAKRRTRTCQVGSTSSVSAADPGGTRSEEVRSIRTWGERDQTARHRGAAWKDQRL
jgi:hypothetical protein